MIKFKKTRIMAIALIICLLFIQSQPVMAKTNEDSFRSSNKPILAAPYLDLNQLAKSTDYSMTTIDKKSYPTYSVDINNMMNKFIVLENTATTAKLLIKEGSVENYVEIHNSGQIFVDGNEIQFTRADGNIKPYSAGATSYFKDNVPYGTAASYSHFVKNDNVSNIALKQKIESIATGTVVTILCAAMSTGYSIVSSIMGTAISEIKRNDSATKYLSVKSKVYAHKDFPNGYIPSLYSCIWKYKMTCYSKTNYTGHSSSFTTYKHYMQG